jgi:hypothetical protein
MVRLLSRCQRSLTPRTRPGLLDSRLPIDANAAADHHVRGISNARPSRAPSPFIHFGLGWTETRISVSNDKTPLGRMSLTNAS